MALNNKCPNCGSTNIWVSDGPYYDGPDDCWRYMHCVDCGAHWKETYGMELKTIELLGNAPSWSGGVQGSLQ